MAANILVGGVPSSVVLSETGDSDITLYDVESYTITENATNFENNSGDKANPMDGGNVNCSFTGSITFYDSAEYESLAPQAGDSFTKFNGTFTGYGGGSAHTMTTVLNSALAVITNISGSNSNGRRAISIDFDIFSTDGSTYPVEHAYT